MSSTSMPSRVRAGGQEVREETSALAASSSTMARPSGVAMSMPTERFPRLNGSHK